MKVALYYPWLYLTSGAERTILEITGNGRHEWTIFTNRFEPENTFPGFRDRDVRTLEQISVKRTVSAAGRGALKILRQRLPLESFGALVVVCEGFGDLVLFRNHSLPTICICLTPLRLAFDHVYRERCLAAHSRLKGMLIRFGSALFRVVDRMAWRHYACMFCISHETNRRAAAGGLAPDAAIDVVHPGLGFVPDAPSGEFEKFFLLPGRIMWAKNIELGIEAFRLFKKKNAEFRDFRLIIAGIVDRKSEAYLQKLRSMARAEGLAIEFRIHPSDQELAELYRKCYATLFTAFNEDWGMVPLESMAFGKPSICVNRGGPKESVIDNNDGFLVEPEQQAFAQKMSLLAKDPERCRKMGLAGHQNARRFSWPNFKKHIDDAIDTIASVAFLSGSSVDPGSSSANVTRSLKEAR